MGREGSDKRYATPIEAFIDIYEVPRETIVAFSTEREDANNDILYLAIKVGEHVEGNVAFVEKDAEGTMIRWVNEDDGPTAANPSREVLEALTPLTSDRLRSCAPVWRGTAQASLTRRREYPRAR
jgi:hypothetical protein